MTDRRVQPLRQPTGSRLWWHPGPAGVMLRAAFFGVADSGGPISASGSATGTGTATAVGVLVVRASGTATGTGTATANAEIVGGELTAELYAVSHVTGSVATPANALAAFDGVYTTDANANVSWTSRWRLGTVAGGPWSAVGTQTITIRARKGSNTGNPSISAVTLWQGGVQIATISSGSTSITSTSGQDLVLTFAGDLLTGLEDVDIQIATTGTAGSGTQRNAVAVDGIRWDAVYAAVGGEVLQGAGTATGTGTATASAVLVVRASGSATGTGTATADATVGVAPSSASASATGTGAATADGVLVVRASGSATGTGTATADGVLVVRASGSATGTGTATASAVLVVRASAAAVGVGVATGRAVLVLFAGASATGIGTATANGVIAIVQSRRRIAFPSDSANGGTLGPSLRAGTLSPSARTGTLSRG